MKLALYRIEFSPKACLEKSTHERADAYSCISGSVLRSFQNFATIEICLTHDYEDVAWLENELNQDEAVISYRCVMSGED